MLRDIFAIIAQAPNEIIEPANVIRDSVTRFPFCTTISKLRAGSRIVSGTDKGAPHKYHVDHGA